MPMQHRNRPGAHAPDAIIESKHDETGRKHPPATRWEHCSKCKLIYPPDSLSPIAESIPGRKRGWLCDECAERLSDIHS